MVGNNSSGSRSIIYGETKDKLLRVRGVLAGGEAATFGPCDGDDLRTGLAGPESERLAPGLEAMRSRLDGRLAERWPRTARRVSGYNLPELVTPTPNLARLLAGSEGTLALFTEVEVQLDERPAARPLAALTFATIRAALRANLAILPDRAVGRELIDLVPLRRSPNLRRFSRLAPILDGDDPAVLLVEYQGSRDEGLAGLERLRAVVARPGGEHRHLLRRPRRGERGLGAAPRLAAAAHGRARRRAPGLVRRGHRGAAERLADFVEEFQRIVAAHGARASFTGHTSAGCMHVRPMLDLKTAAGVERLDAIAREVGRLVASFTAPFGRARRRLLALLVQPRAVRPRAVRRARRPQGPVRPAPPAQPRPQGRGAAAHRQPAPGRRLPRPRRAGCRASPMSARAVSTCAVERCFGAGLCKKQMGTMCPPAAVSRDEWHTTRARANLLQAIVAGAVPLGELAGEEFEEVLGTCVACKACAPSARRPSTWPRSRSSGWPR